MANLDDLEKIKSLDSSFVLESVSLLPDQIRQAWQGVWGLSLPASFGQVKNLVAAGMGGSALGALIIDSLSFEALKAPLEIVKGYHLPAYAGKDSLVLVSSYSGNTQETLSSFQEALKRDCQVFVITTDGKLAKIVKKNQLPAYVFAGDYNPSKQPRLGLGYSIAAQLALLAKVGLLRLEKNQMTEMINHLGQLKECCSLPVLAKKNLAKKIALAFDKRAVIVVSAEHLIGAAHAFKNMINENSKRFSLRFSLPELNHHLLEGLTYPEENKRFLKFLFIESAIYDEEIEKRFKVTKEVVEKNGIETHSLKLKGRTRLAQVFETIYLGGFVSAYLAFLNDIDPAPIPWVDYFKRRLKKYK
jgi:glucose/mannose-6-phosphate isomerase